MCRIGLINIGDSPIAGIEEEKQLYFRECEIVETGALDGLMEDELEEVCWKGEGDILTVERKDGSVLRLQKDKLLPLIQSAIERASQAGCRIFYIHCTGFFSELTCPGLLVRPGQLLKSLVSGFCGKTVIFTPTEEHVRQVERKWKAVLPDADIIAVLPVGYEAVLETWKERLQQYDAVLLDCASYGIRFVEKIKENYNGIIMCALTLAFAQCSVLAYDKKKQEV